MSRILEGKRWRRGLVEPRFPSRRPLFFIFALARLEEMFNIERYSPNTAILAGFEIVQMNWS